MGAQDDVPAAEVFAIIEEPTTQMGLFKRIVHIIASPFAGQMIPRGTHPVVVEKATGKKLRGELAESVLIKNMQEDLETMTAREFHNRYLN